MGKEGQRKTECGEVGTKEDRRCRRRDKGRQNVGKYTIETECGEEEHGDRMQGSRDKGRQN